MTQDKSNLRDSMTTHPMVRQTPSTSVHLHKEDTTTSATEEEEETSTFLADKLTSVTINIRTNTVTMDGD